MATMSAPEAQFNSAFSNGQSATASVPSLMPSVSLLGEATEPESRWSRVMATGPISPLRTIWLMCFANLSRSP